MREIRTYGSEGGAAQTNAPSLPLPRRRTDIEKKAWRRPPKSRIRETLPAAAEVVRDETHRFVRPRQNRESGMRDVLR